MIIKNFELEKIKSKNLNFFLFYGENEGFKDEKIKQIFINDFKGSVEKFEESEVLNNTDRFISSIINKSFFEEKKIIILSRVSDKILTLIKDLLDRGANDTIIILNSGNLEKKSKLRSFFEKDKKNICIAFYPDNEQILSKLAFDFFKNKKITISEKNINLIINKCNGDREILLNELLKIEYFSKNLLGRTPMTATEAEDLYTEDVRKHEVPWKNQIKVPLTQNMFDAIASFAFNTGRGGPKKYGVIEPLNRVDSNGNPAPDYQAAAEAIRNGPQTSNGRKLRGLVKRRNREADEFLTGISAVA